VDHTARWSPAATYRSSRNETASASVANHSWIRRSDRALAAVKRAQRRLRAPYGIVEVGEAVEEPAKRLRADHQRRPLRDLGPLTPLQDVQDVDSEPLPLAHRDESLGTPRQLRAVKSAEVVVLVELEIASRQKLRKLRWRSPEEAGHVGRRRLAEQEPVHSVDHLTDRRPECAQSDVLQSTPPLLLKPLLRVRDQSLDDESADEKCQ
jgi:hypothetical protein